MIFGLRVGPSVDQLGNVLASNGLTQVFWIRCWAVLARFWPILVWHYGSSMEKLCGEGAPNAAGTPGASTRRTPRSAFKGLGRPRLLPSTSLAPSSVSELLNTNQNPNNRSDHRQNRREAFKERKKTYERNETDS